ncbi:hypothetical protein ACFV9D_19225 [Streptomyces sp. NPDC059875]|uniref:hypothetical protein n=1 Tax=unclassified Streptomyces TaxID=2593676 RepID=UPI003661A018
MPDEITLRPVTADDLDLYEREFSGPDGWGVHQWFGFQPTADLRRRFAENGLLGPDGGLRSAVWRGGQWNDLVNYSVLRAERTGGTAK